MRFVCVFFLRKYEGGEEIKKNARKLQNSKLQESKFSKIRSKPVTNTSIEVAKIRFLNLLGNSFSSLAVISLPTKYGPLR